MIAEIKQLRKIQKMVAQRDRLSNKIDLERELLRATCTHPKRHPYNDYVEGSYYDLAVYRTYDMCLICGDKKLIKEETGSYA